MRRILRWLTGAAAVLFVAICVLWARSYWWSDVVGLNTSPPGPTATSPLVVGPPTGTFVGLSTSGGSLYFVRYTTYDAQNPLTGWSSARIGSPDDFYYAHAQFYLLGFSFSLHGSDYTFAFVGVPLWLGLVACALPAVAKRFRARR